MLTVSLLLNKLQGEIIRFTGFCSALSYHLSMVTSCYSCIFYFAFLILWISHCLGLSLFSDSKFSSNFHTWKSLLFLIIDLQIFFSLKNCPHRNEFGLSLFRALLIYPSFHRAFLHSLLNHALFFPSISIKISSLLSQKNSQHFHYS